jgi:hypothetical protein
LFFNYEMTEYPSSAEVSSAVPVNNTVTIGVVVDPWNLNFGIIPQGNNYGTRFVDLGNMKENDAKVSFKIYGTIAPFVTFSKNNFMLHSKENTTVQLNFNASTAQIGNYTGQIDVVVQRPKYDFVYSFWS